MIKLRKDKVRKYLTPYKRMEPVIAGSGEPGAFDEKGVDCPFVFRATMGSFIWYIPDLTAKAISRLWQ